MKRIHFFFALVAVSLVFASCKTYEEERDAALLANDSLQSIIDNKDAELDSLFSTLNEIEENLASVSARYNAVQELRRANVEGQPTVKSQINDQIASIEKLMSANKQKVAALQAKLNASNQESAKLQELLSHQEERIAAQESQIAQLLTELENSKVVIRKLNQDVSDLTVANQEKDRTIQGHIADANRAYYIVGQYAELRDAGIVSKSGGFIGIGTSLQPNSNLPVEKFTQIDRTKVTTIQINMRKAQVVSKHPENSYELVMDENDSRMVSYLRILNPAKFWEQTRFLVISTR